jgi:hypothetical protein
MKKYLPVLFFMLSYFFSKAQGEITITGANKISKQHTPQQVIDSLEARFPDAKSIKYYKTPPDAVAKGWDISVENNMESGADIEYYTIKFRRKDFQYYGLYKHDGTLVESKYRETVSHIPENIKNSLKQLSQQYPGYKLKTKTFYKNTSYSNSKEYYEFIAFDGQDKKRIIYDGNGNLVKVK